MKIDFQISYTLDVLCYINCLISQDKKKLYEEDITKFMPILGTVSDKYIIKLQSILVKNPNFILHIVSVLIDNKNLHNWKTADLLDNFKRLIAQFKKSKYFKNANSELKKFVSSDFVKTMHYVNTIAIDLERLGFKNFWLKEKLPILKESIIKYQERLEKFDIVAHVNNWLTDDAKLEYGSWYVLAYSGNQFERLLKYFNIVSPIIAAEDLFERVVSSVLKTADYTSLIRNLKPDAILKAEFKTQAKHSIYRKLKSYVEICLKMALKVYLVDQTPDSPIVAIPEHYSFASRILSYLQDFKKDDNITIALYIAEMMKYLSRKK